MNVKIISEKQIAKDAAKMTLLSLAMQTAGMIFNVKLSDMAGTSAVGLMSLIFSLFGFIMVLANGNILTSTGRFVSEARGAGHENFCTVMRYSLTFFPCACHCASGWGHFCCQIFLERPYLKAGSFPYRCGSLPFHCPLLPQGRA
ncbi:MAG: hypothetical protein L6V87_01275 [Ruminococcus sp.]|nr:MAG: hypothetical protein L6V87_01275 [Ruminococcus sp.]